MIDVTNDGPGRWTAIRAGQPAGTLAAFVRPDSRCCVYAQVAPDDIDTLVALHKAALSTLDTDVFTEIDFTETGEPAAEVRVALVALGYEVNRHEHHYAIPIDAIDADRAPLPPGFTVVSAVDADIDRLRQLDDAVRQDCPAPTVGATTRQLSPNSCAPTHSSIRPPT